MQPVKLRPPKLFTRLEKKGRGGFDAIPPAPKAAKPLKIRKPGSFAATLGKQLEGAY